jgi:hypothetical protein
VDFTVTPSNVPASEFHIEVRYPGTQPTVSQLAAFDAAKARWQSAIIGDLFDIPGIAIPPSAECAAAGHPAAVSGPIDDVVIFANLVTIDGSGGILGQAGPCFIRDEMEVNIDLTVTGVMMFDIADLAMLETAGRLNDVIVHEMAHVLGFGTLWRVKNLLQGRGTSNPFFTGPSAGGAFLAAVLGGSTFTGEPVPVENTGQLGTREAHWRKSIVSPELMIGEIGSGASPLSAFSLASLRDLGYVVNDAVADPFTFMPQILGGFGGEIQLNELPLSGPIIMIDRQGRETGRRPRL